MSPIGGYIHPTTEIEINAGRAVTTLRVTNLGDRPVQVGSHHHFAESNRALRFDRMAAYGQRLDIPAGTAARFEPGERREGRPGPLARRRRAGGLHRRGWAGSGGAPARPPVAAGVPAARGPTVRRG